MKSKIYITIIFIISILLGSVLGYKINDSTGNMKIYSIESSNNDSSIILENLKLVSAKNDLYIQPNYLIRIKDNINIDSLKLRVTIDNQEIISLTLVNDNNTNNFTIDDGTLLKNININKNSIANVYFNYVIDDKTYDYSKEVILKDEFKTEQ